MVTIKDIAKLAGVAQGTVSNVLNGKGNVSSEKIKRVMDAAHALGYVPNGRAALLRKGRNDALAVIMPDTRARQYEDFYLSFKSYARDHGYTVTRFHVNENAPEAEAEALAEVRPLMVKGIACISTVAGTAYEERVYKEGGRVSAADLAKPTDSSEDGGELPGILFIDRRPGFEADFMGFDYRRAGEAMAGRAMAGRYQNVCLLTGSLSCSSEADFYQGFTETMGETPCQVTHIRTDYFRRYQNIMQIFNGPMPQAFFISNYGFAESVKDICVTFYGSGESLDIYTVSPLFTMPENDFVKYEMDYRQLGKLAAERLIRQAQGKEGRGDNRQLLESRGFQDWYPGITTPRSRKPINVITLDSPEAYIMRNFSRLYTKKTGIDVNICIFSYDEIYEAFNMMDSSSDFDVLRLDVTWLSWFARQLLVPLTEIDPEIGSAFGEFVEGTPSHYAMAHGQIYALPSTPSAQILYYRKDLFESPIYKRMYYEQFRTELAPPQTFQEFNRIASFFTRSVNGASPVDYGATITMGSTGVAGSEYLARLFSRQENLYDGQGEIHLDSEAGTQALKELVELKHYTSPDYCSWWTNTAGQFAKGDFAMSVLYSNYASDLLGHRSRVVGNIGWTMMPGANPVIGGGSLGVSRYSRHPEDALSFIRWICSEPISSAAALLGSTSPCWKTYDNYEVMGSFPWLSLSKKCFTLTKGNRIPESAKVPFDERRFLSILGMAVKNAYSGVTSPEEALKNAQELFGKYFQTKF